VVRPASGRRPRDARAGSPARHGSGRSGFSCPGASESEWERRRARQTPKVRFRTRTGPGRSSAAILQARRGEKPILRRVRFSHRPGWAGRPPPLTRSSSTPARTTPTRDVFPSLAFVMNYGRRASDFFRTTARGMPIYVPPISMYFSGQAAEMGRDKGDEEKSFLFLTMDGVPRASRSTGWRSKFRHPNAKRACHQAVCGYDAQNARCTRTTRCAGWRRPNGSAQRLVWTAQARAGVNFDPPIPRPMPNTWERAGAGIGILEIFLSSSISRSRASLSLDGTLDGITRGSWIGVVFRFPAFFSASPSLRIGGAPPAHPPPARRKNCTLSCDDKGTFCNLRTSVPEGKSAVRLPEAAPPTEGGRGGRRQPDDGKQK